MCKHPAVDYSRMFFYIFNGKHGRVEECSPINILVNTL